ncbi:hypothetical protein HHK36_028880 [Tetracentron sinense]|uniref:Uncharacterized protein n=1 Tax=Tetracentron sinense TaxID=13715 RepID=A0A834YDX0_TETSI|nr:hypothetical protein HHK36_028880 [Tetracentron sinense]
MEISPLQQYRHDRRKLLDFILSSGLIKEVRTPSGPVDLSDVDLDTLSADYVLECIRSGGVLDVSEATKKYHDELGHPINFPLGCSYFLISDPDFSGSPPRRIPPQVKVKLTTNYRSCSSSELDPLVVEKIAISGDEDGVRHTAATVAPLKPVENANIPSLGLPTLNTVSHAISEAMDACIRQRLMQFVSRTTCGQIDAPQISLGLLNCIVKSDFHNDKSYMQWKKRQANILEELLYCSSTFKTAEHMNIRSSLSKIRNTEEWEMRMSPSERTDVLLAIRRFSSKLSSLSGEFGIQGETYYWTRSYHLNIKLYEKLLSCVFDILEEGQLIEEADEILMLIKLTWSTLGITQKMHDILYVWVLFRQFVETDEEMLLEYAILEVRKVLPNKDAEGKEEAYMNNLVCSIGTNGSKIKLSLVYAVFFSMSIWCDSKLQDYHLHFSKVNSSS